MKRVGIITMHKVLNYGSALQAYALQSVVEKMGFRCEIIDYLYPNAYHLSLRPHFPVWKRMVLWIIQLLYGFPERRRERKFWSFYRDFFHLSAKQYRSREEIAECPPRYDIYLTGSDQVWNPKYIGRDMTFMLSFVQVDAPKVSYSSSFATDSVPREYVDLYRECLKSYSSISVREQGGVEIVRGLTGQDAEVVLDPTMLLSAEEYDSMAERSSIQIDEPYILAYILGYSFNPYPYVEELIRHVRKKTGYKVYLLNVSNVKMLFEKDTRRLQDVGPAEFAYLFRHAAFVITTSFHGTAFSINFQKPFYSLLSRGNRDDRLASLLSLCGLSDRAIYMGQEFPADINMESSSASVEKLQRLKEKSLEVLRKGLSGHKI